MPDAARWTPLLEGDDAIATRTSIEAIATGVRGLVPEDFAGASVSDGIAGAAILYSYLDRAEPRAGLGGLASSAYDHAVAGLESVERIPSLHVGFTGLGWVGEHLRDELADVDEHTNDGIDDGVSSWLSSRRADYDLINGLVGLGVYAIERLPGDGGARCLELVIRRLAELAEPDRGGVTWRTPPGLLSPWLRPDFPDGWFNLGIAHGVPGVIALLGHAWETGIARPVVTSLLEGGVRWLLDRRQRDAASAFPCWLRPGHDGAPGSSRLAWCYGDLGAAAALLGAARRADRPDWRDAALDLARATTRRDPRGTGVADAGLCHGAAGVAHLYNRLYQASGDELLRDAARAWFRKVLAMRQPSHGLGGYLSWGPRPGGPDDPAHNERVWYQDPSLLTGEIGIALAQLAAISSIEPAWDRLLLAS